MTPDFDNGLHHMRCFTRLTLVLLYALPLSAQSAVDTAAIRAASLDYAEGWYQGNPARMSRAVHPELVKRIVVSDTASGRSVIQNMGASALINATKRGFGKETPAERQQRDVSILDIFGNAASAKVVMADWIDYLQLARVDGRWVIVNVLWERKPVRDSATSSSAWLGRLPDGPAKRKFILDCTGCHQFDAQIALTGARPRTHPEWVEAVKRMLGYAGARSSFPVIAADRDPESTAAWLTRHLGSSRQPGSVPAGSSPAEIKEFLMPEPKDLPHDVVVEPDGSVLITGMFTHRLYRLDPVTGRFTEIEIPVPESNPRAIDLDAGGRPWVVLGHPKMLATIAADSQWRSFDVGMYPHSLAIGNGEVWFNGHFTHNPELIGSVDAAGKVVTHRVPPHPTLDRVPGGPMPYEIRVGPDGRVWGSELIGNRIFGFTPASRRFEVYELPTSHSGPRRFDIDPKGVLWIPAYAANLLVRFDPSTRKFREIRLPVPDALPYVVRVEPRTGALWIGTAAADALLRYHPKDERFEVYPLPSRGALVRHLALDSRTGAVWAAYGEAPGIPARIARLLPR